MTRNTQAPLPARVVPALRDRPSSRSSGGSASLPDTNGGPGAPPNTLTAHRCSGASVWGTHSEQFPSPSAALSLSAVAGGGAELRSTPHHVLVPSSRLLPSPLLHLSEHSHKYFLLILICTEHILFSLQESQKIKTFLITFEFPLIINLERSSTNLCKLLLDVFFRNLRLLFLFH